MTPYYADDWLTVYAGDCRDVLPTLAAESIDCVVTSPPYWQQRSYLAADHALKSHELGSEPTLEEWIGAVAGICEQLRLVLKPRGSLWLVLGDRYAPTGGHHYPTTCPPGGVVLDPFAGTGTTAQVANALMRRAVLIELDPSSLEAIARRTEKRPIAAVPA